MSDEFSRVVFAKVDVDECVSSCYIETRRYQITKNLHEYFTLYYVKN